MEGEPPYGEVERFTTAEKSAYRRSEEGRVLVETGLLETDEDFLFVCPFCGRWQAQSQRLEPVCNGVDGEHPLEPMILANEQLLGLLS